MAGTWGDQAADINQHNDNLLFAIESDLLPGIVESFADINEAGHLNEVIESLKEAGATMEDGELIMTAAAQEIVDNLNDSFGEQLNAREALAETIAGMQVDLEGGSAEIIQGFMEMVEGLDLSEECRAAGIATIQGLIEGMREQEGEVGNAADGIGEEILTVMKAALDMNSPSRAMMDIGKGAVVGLVKGIESKQGEAADAFRELGESALEAIKSIAESGEAESIGETLGDRVVEGATGVDYAAIPQEIASAISGGEGAVVSAAEAMATGVLRKFEEMRQQADMLAHDMMTMVQTAITSQTAPIHAAMEIAKTGVLNALTPLPMETSAIIQDTMVGMAQTAAALHGNVEQAFRPLQVSLPRITTEAMNGAYQALVAGGDRLIARARATADAVAAAMASALRVNSPSRVMIDLFGHVMEGIYVALDKGEDSLLKKAESIAENLADALTIEPDLIDDMVCKVQAIVDTGFISPRATMAPASMFAGGTGANGPIYHIHNTANITAPEAMSEYQISREMEDMSERMKWKLK